jgi:copper transport protein
MLRIIAVVLGLVGAVLSGGVAEGHAVRIDTFPADRAVLADPPEAVTVRFNESVSPLILRVLDQVGRDVAVPGSLTSVDGTIRVRIPPAIPAGTYVLVYRVVSGDGHPVGGSTLFSVGGTEVVDIGLTETDTTSLRIAGTAVRAIYYFGLLVAGGGALFLLLCLRGEPGLAGAIGRRIVAASAATGGAGLVLLALDGAVVGGLDASTLLTAAPWRVAASISLSRAVALALVGLCVICGGVLIGSGRRAGQLLLGLGALLLLMSQTLTGHVVSAEPRWLVITVISAHLLAGAYWIGSLWPLIIVLRKSDQATAAQTVRRFARLAIAAVLVLVVAGATVTAVQVQELAELTRTNYGMVWLAKIVGVCGLLLLAAYNKFRLTPALANGSPHAPGRLVRAIRLELIVAAAVVSATAGFSRTVPPRILADAALHARHLAEHGTMGPHAGHRAGSRSRATAEVLPAFVVEAAERGYRLAIEVTPGADFQNALTLTIAAPNGTELVPLEVGALFAMPALEVEGIERRFVLDGQRRFHLAAVELPFPGEWVCDVDVLVSDFERVSFRIMLPIIDLR